jgi:hypothetical protein
MTGGIPGEFDAFITFRAAPVIAQERFLCLAVGWPLDK